jgi:hypothetical protein
MLVSGFVIGELFSEWPAAQAAFLWAPEQVARLLSLAPHNGWVKGVWMLLVCPLALWLVLGQLVCLAGDVRGMGEAWRRLALPLAVVVASGHMAKGLAKFTSWVGYLPGAARDPWGADTAQAIDSRSMSPPAAILPMWLVALLGLVLIGTGTYFALREARLADPVGSPRLRLPILMVAVAFALLVCGWLAVG